MSFLQGNRTYIIAGLTALIGLVNLVTGFTGLEQFLADPNLLVLLGGLGLGTLRASIQK